jgi:hypothetical protein
MMGCEDMLDPEIDGPTSAWARRGLVVASWFDPLLRAWVLTMTCHGQRATDDQVALVRGDFAMEGAVEVPTRPVDTVRELRLKEDP